MDQTFNPFTENNPSYEYNKMLQDDLSLIVKKDAVYNLDEVKKDMVILSFPQWKMEATHDSVPCSIVGDDLKATRENNGEEDNVSINSYN